MQYGLKSDENLEGSSQSVHNVLTPASAANQSQISCQNQPCFESVPKLTPQSFGAVGILKSGLNHLQDQCYLHLTRWQQYIQKGFATPFRVARIWEVSLFINRRVCAMRGTAEFTLAICKMNYTFQASAAS